MDDFLQYREEPSTPLNIVGGGRGSINPPSLGQTYQQSPYQQPTTQGTNIGYAGLPPSAQSLAGFTEAGVRGLTGGLSDYLYSGLAKGADTLRGGDMPFAEMLAAVRARNAQANQNAPYATTTGNLVGQVYTGARILPAAAEALVPGSTLGVGGLASVAGQQAAQGSVNAATAEGATPESIGKAAVAQGSIGGALSAVGKVLGAGYKYLDNRFVKNLVTETDLTEAEIRGQYNAPPAGASQEERAIYNFKNSASTNIVLPTADRLAAIEELKTSDPKQYRKFISQWSDVAEDLIGPGYIAKEGVKAASKTALGLVVPVAGTVAGGYVGSKVAPIVGIDPKTGAEIGMVLGGGTSLIGAKNQLLKSGMAGIESTAGMASLRYPNAIPNILNKSPGVITSGASAIVPQPKDDYNQYKESSEDFSQFKE